jgi:hypothetical protein
VTTPADLYGRYAHHYDDGHADLFAALFTVDAVFATAGREPVRGRAAIAETARRGMTALPGVRHLVSSTSVEVAADGTTATGRAYVQAVQVDGTSLHPVTAGEYTDRFVFVEGRWLIDDHRYQPFPGVGSATP